MLSSHFTFSSLWSLSYYFTFFYIVLVLSTSLYLIPQVSTFTNYGKFKNHSSYIHITPLSISKLLYTPLFLIILLNVTWVGPTVSTWFGHIIFSSFQYGMVFFISFCFIILLYTYLMAFIFNSKEVYDYIIVVYSMFIWSVLLFCANNIFTIVFFIEILSVLTTLVLVTSLFSSTYFYNQNSLNTSLYFSKIMPNTFLNMLIFFFWVSLATSLLLFVFLILFYIHFLSFDFFLVESIFGYIVSVSTFKQLLTSIMITFILVLVTFFKCGVVPLYVWKPVFFKGMSLHVIFFYICFFYFFLLLFFVYFLIIYFNDFTYYNRVLLTILSVVGTLSMFTILIEAYYLKAFLAMSSILNTLLIFLAIGSISGSLLFINF